MTDLEGSEDLFWHLRVGVESQGGGGGGVLGISSDGDDRRIFLGTKIWFG